jgi:signal transduction histidine kinase
MGSRVRRNRTLTRHLIQTYVLLTVFVGVLLTVASLWAIDTLEAHLQKIDMGMAVKRIREEYLTGSDVRRAGRFFHGEPGSDAFPPWLRNTVAGFSRIEHDGRQFHVMTDDLDGVRYILLRDYTAFEQKQFHFHLMSVAGLACCLLVAFVLGGVTTRRFIAPLIQLATHVGERPGLPQQTRLAQHYPDNEIGQLAVAFDETYNQLEAALQREKLFTADVGHELRTPLMVISSSCELLLDDSSLSPAQSTRLQRALAAAREINQQLTAYLMLARGVRDVSGFALTSTSAAVRDEAEHWRTRAGQLGLALKVDLGSASDAPHGAASTHFESAFPASLLRIVLSNLIRNALQHATDGTCIMLRATPTSIEVADDGPGIPVEVQPHVFAPFIQGKQGGAENLGLGLSLVQRICQQQHWHVSLKSTPGSGSLFHIDLRPAATPAV